jgi:RNA polymerase sigma factor (sigma-70 family)
VEAVCADVATPHATIATASHMTAEELCRRYSTQVCNFANVVARGSNEADDIAQEALLKAMRALPQYKPQQGDIDAWLWRIVVNTARDFSRSRNRRIRLLLRLGTLSTPAVVNAENVAMASLSNRDLRAALARLSYRNRSLLALRFGADMDIRQLAECSGLSPEAAGKAVQRAMQRLKSELKEYGGV